MIKETIQQLIEGRDLAEQAMIEAMRDIMNGDATDAQIASFLTALRIKGETVEEITGAVKVMKEKVHAISAPEGTVDTCGTGGDMANTFNISTVTAIVVAACGVPVAKHGNRSVSSSCGSADILEALGVRIDLPPEKVEACLSETGFGFMFAPMFHPAMKYAIGPRREMGIRTIFNILGPLTNPAGTRLQVLGVFSNDLTEPLARVLGNLGVVHAFIVHGDDGLDEITTTSKTRISELRNGQVRTYYLSPENMGIAPAQKEDLRGGTRDDNLRITNELLAGGKGPKRDIVLMNAAAALVVAGRTEDFIEGRDRAATAIDSGGARKKLNEIIRVSQGL